MEEKFRRNSVPINGQYLFTDEVILAQDAYDMELLVRRLFTVNKKLGLNVHLETRNT